MINTLKNYFFLFSYTAKHTHFVWWSIADGILWGVYNSFTSVVFLKYLFDMIEEERPFSQIMLIVAAMGIYMMLIYIFHENLYNFVWPRTRQQLHEKMHTKLFRKAMSLDLASYDDPKFYNDYIWVLNQFEEEVMDVAFDLGKFINRILSSTVIITLIATIDLYVVLAILFAVMVSVILKYIRTKYIFNKQADLKPYERKADYVGRVFYLADYAQEIRLSRVSEILQDDFDEAIEGQITVHKRYAKKLFWTGILRDFATSILINIGIITLLVYKIMVEGTITLGDFAASISGTWTLFWQLNNLLDYFTKLKGHSLYAEKLRSFLNYENVIKEIAQPVSTPSIESVVLNDVSFQYRGQERECLKNIHMEIKKNEKIAIVGYNGAGKSTLVKLIMRLYDPTSGQIEWNGENIQHMGLRAYRQKIGVVFQNFQNFAVSLCENVKADIVFPEDRDRIQQVLTQSGLGDKVISFPKGLDTEITKEFDEDGVNLSGGEQQKLAIARALMKDGELIILDEPSSALDPLSEYELNQVILSAALDKTVIFISHRLSTTVMADRIYMLDDGRIIEQGNHTELMELNGKYAEMFRMQAEKYQMDYSAS